MSSIDAYLVPTLLISNWCLIARNIRSPDKTSTPAPRRLTEQSFQRTSYMRDAQENAFSESSK